MTKFILTLAILILSTLPGYAAKIFGDYTQLSAQDGTTSINCFGGRVGGHSIRTCGLVSTTGNIAMTANPQVAVGGANGDQIQFIGLSDTDFLTFHNGDGLVLPESCDLTNGTTMQLTLVGSVYYATGGNCFGAGGGTWGSITGVLANQADLQSALDAKATAANLTAHTGSTANPHNTERKELTQTVTATGDVLTLASGNHRMTRVRVDGNAPITLSTNNPFSTTGLSTGHEAIIEGNSFTNPVTISVNNKAYKLSCIDSGCTDRTGLKVVYLGASAFDVLEVTPHAAEGTIKSCYRVGRAGDNEAAWAVDANGMNLVDSSCDPSDATKFNKPLNVGGWTMKGDGTTAGYQRITGQFNDASCTAATYPTGTCKPACLILELGNDGSTTKGLKLYHHVPDNKLYYVYDSNLDSACPGNDEGTAVDGGSIPYGTAPVLDSDDDIAHDTTGNQLLYGATPQVLNPDGHFCFTIKDITTDWDSVPFFSPADPITIKRVRCITTGSSTPVAPITIGDGTNNFEEISCGATATYDDGSITNASFTQGEQLYFNTGTIGGTVIFVNVCLWYVWDRM